jgi:hypothetical protein
MAPQPHHAPAPLVSEQTLLGALLLHHHSCSRVIRFLRPEHFSHPAHRQIFEIIGGIVRDHSVANPVTVLHAARDLQVLDEIGGAAYLTQLAEAAAKHEDVKRLARQLVEITTDDRTRSGNWSAWYNDYLNSDDWRAKRRLVMDRCGGLCEGCRNSTVTEIHHLTYEHVGAEFLYELVGLCGDCHLRAHQK